MKFNELRQQIEDMIDAGISVQLISAPGRGKSEFVEDLVEYLSARDNEEWGFSTAFLATYTPPDLIGYQFKGEGEYNGQTYTKTDASMPLWMITRTGNPVFAYKRGILFLDEYSQAEGDVKRASAELLLNKRVGPWQLPEGWAVIAAGNTSSHRSGVTKDFDFVINRRAQFQITDDIVSWEEWATTRGIMPLTIAFAHQNPNVVFQEDVPKEQGPWCTPRSLVAADRFLQAKAKRLGELPTDSHTIEAVSGIMGVAETAAYFAFVRLEREMPRYETIVEDPMGVKVSDKPDANMLMCYNLAARVEKEDCGQVIKYVERLPKEFAVTFAQSACRRNNLLVTHPAMSKWAMTNASLMAVITKNTAKAA